MEKSHRIRIHPPGAALSNPDQAIQLSALSPTGFRKAQDLLVATDHYLHKTGLFPTKRSRLKTVHTSLGELIDCLKRDGFISGQVFSDEELTYLFIFLSEFSDSFPNWQEEYEALNAPIPAWWAERSA